MQTKIQIFQSKMKKKIFKVPDILLNNLFHLINWMKYTCHPKHRVAKVFLVRTVPKLSFIVAKLS